jgi:predicted Zn-dependent peptidase
VISPDLPPHPPSPQTIQVLSQAEDHQQTIVALGYPAVSVHHADYLGLKFLITYLCNGMSSRLFSELREKQGLAYEVSGFYPTRQANSHFITYLGTTPSNAERALTQMRGELDRLGEGAMTEDELAIVKRKWAGQYALGKQTNGQIAQIYGWYEILGLDSDYDQGFLTAMAAFPLESVHRIAQTYFAHPIFSVVGPADSIEFTKTLK